MMYLIKQDSTLFIFWRSIKLFAAKPNHKSSHDSLRNRKKKTARASKLQNVKPYSFFVLMLCSKILNRYLNP